MKKLSETHVIFAICPITRREDTFSSETPNPRHEHGGLSNDGRDWAKVHSAFESQARIAKLHSRHNFALRQRRAVYFQPQTIAIILHDVRAR